MSLAAGVQYTFALLSATWSRNVGADQGIVETRVESIRQTPYYSGQDRGTTQASVPDIGAKKPIM